MGVEPDGWDLTRMIVDRYGVFVMGMTLLLKPCHRGPIAESSAEEEVVTMNSKMMNMNYKHQL